MALFRVYHLLLDEQADELLSMTDTITEQIRKIGGLTLRSIDLWIVAVFLYFGLSQQRVTQMAESEQKRQE